MFSDSSYFLRELTADEKILWCPFVYEKLKQMGDILNNLTRRLYSFLCKTNIPSGDNQLLKIIWQSVKSTLQADSDILEFIKKHRLPIRYESPLFTVHTDSSVGSNNTNGNTPKLTCKKLRDDLSLTGDCSDVTASDLEDLELLLKQDEKTQVNVKVEPPDIEQEAEVNINLTLASTVIYDELYRIAAAKTAP